MVNEVEVSENKDALIVLAGTVAAAATVYCFTAPTAGKRLFLKEGSTNLKHFQEGLGL